MWSIKFLTAIKITLAPGINAVFNTAINNQRSMFLLVAWLMGLL